MKRAPSCVFNKCTALSVPPMESEVTAGRGIRYGPNFSHYVSHIDIEHNVLSYVDAAVRIHSPGEEAFFSSFNLSTIQVPRHKLRTWDTVDQGIFVGLRYS